MRRAKERSRQNFAVVLGFVERAVRSIPDPQKERERERTSRTRERERERTKRDHIISGLLSQKHIIIVVVEQHQQQRERENKKNTNEENLVRGGAPS